MFVDVCVCVCVCVCVRYLSEISSCPGKLIFPLQTRNTEAVTNLRGFYGPIISRTEAEAGSLEAVIAGRGGQSLRGPRRGKRTASALDTTHRHTRRRKRTHTHTICWLQLMC